MPMVSGLSSWRGNKPLSLVVTAVSILVVVLFLLHGGSEQQEDSASQSLRGVDTVEGSVPPPSGSLSPPTADPTADTGISAQTPQRQADMIGQPFYSIRRTTVRKEETQPPPTTETTTAAAATDEQKVPTTTQPLPTFYPSKDLFVRAVYFDSRPRDEHRNTSVFLVVCLKSITDNSLITGCQVDGRKAEKYSVDLIGETPLWRAFYPHINHEEVLVHCYDLPARNGSTAHIAYKTSPEAPITLLAASERPYVIPAPRIYPTSVEGRRYNMTIVTCAKIFNHPPWLKEWLTYQRTLGVDHVHLDAEDSFQKSGMMTQQFLMDMMAEGFVSIDIWKKYLSPNEIWYHNQGLIYEDCPYRFRGTYDYIVMVDTDDFFTPRVPTEKKLHYYIHNFCRGGTVASCKFRWVEYYPDYVGLNNESVSDGNVTRQLNNYLHYNQGNPKSLHRTTVLIDTATHYAYKMMPGYTIFNVPVSTAYVAHVRLYKKQPERGFVGGLPNVCSEHVLSKILLLVSLTVCTFVLLVLGS